MPPDGDVKTSDYVVRCQPKAPLRDAPGGKQVAVVPTGTVLHGLVEPHEGALWLRIDLAPSNPLREKRGLTTLWTCIGNDQEPLLEWDGPMDADLSGSIFKVKWVPPVSESFCASYAIESKQDGGEWNVMWRSPVAGQDNVEEGLIVTNMLWPRARRAIVRIAAYAKARDADGGVDPSAVASPPSTAPRPPASSGEGLRFASTPFTVNADIFDMRFMDKGVVHLRKLKAALADAVRQADKQLNEHSTSVASVEECLREVVAAMDARALILRRAVEFAAPRGPITSRKRVLIGPGGGGTSGAGIVPRSFNRVLIMGLYHSCTHAVARELEQRFDVEVLNARKPSKEGTLWKHRVHHHPLEAMASDVLAVLLVKEPHFWLKSISREERNFWEIHPFREDELGEREDVAPSTITDLFEPFEHDTIIYPHAVGLWNDAVRSYFDDDVYPPDQSVVVRCEDFLFKFHEVMDQLAALGLRDKEPGVRPEPVSDRARNTRTCRSREQARRFYGDHKNWKSDFRQEELETIAAEVDAEALNKLHYGGSDPMWTWTGQARPTKAIFVPGRAVQARQAEASDASPSPPASSALEDGESERAAAGSPVSAGTAA